MKDNAPRLAAVIGWPIEHSLSPLIHQTWAAREGVNGWYIPLGVEGGYEEFAKAADSLKTIGFNGANVTLPHKEHALRYCATASDGAQSAGAANMITFREAGAHAENSDIEGFSESLKKCLKPDDDKERALILGAGGASGGVALALRSLGYESLVITNRTQSKADALAADLEGSVETVPWQDRNSVIGAADVIVNTTSLGMTGQPPLEIDLSAAKPTAIISDIVYTPLETPLLKAAAAKGLRAMDGLSMLMHQAVPGYKAWLGKEAAVDDDLRVRLVEALNARET